MFPLDGLFLTALDVTNLQPANDVLIEYNSLNELAKNNKANIYKT